MLLNPFPFLPLRRTDLVSKESFNILFVGESGLGKSTLQADIFRELDPMDVQALKQKIAEKRKIIDDVVDQKHRTEREIQMAKAEEDDQRGFRLREEQEELKQQMETEERELARLRVDLSSRLDYEVGLRREIRELREASNKERELGGKQNFLAAGVLKREVECLEDELISLCQSIPSTRASGGPIDTQQQTLDVQTRHLRSMPLYHGAREALDVELIDTPGYGDLVVGTENSFKAVHGEVHRRIRQHLEKTEPSRSDLSLDAEKIFFNPLVHACLFFIGPHRMKRDDIELMRQLHKLVPLVVVVAKSDTMTVEETRDYKKTVKAKLKQEQIETYTFDAKAISAVESKQQEELRTDEDFNPLYGGEGIPWAVIGAKHGGKRCYKWGTANTNDPHHSELPALRDVMLRFGGWKTLKECAARKADQFARDQAQQEEQRRLHAESEREALLQKRKNRSLCARIFGYSGDSDADQPML